MKNVLIGEERTRFSFEDGDLGKDARVMSKHGGVVRRRENGGVELSHC
jgi:hypothetical protein